MRRRWWVALTVVTLFASTALATPAAAAPNPADPTTWRCGSSDLGLGDDTVELAPVLQGDRQPNGAAITRTPDPRGRFVPVIMIHGWTGSDTVSTPTDRSGAFSHLIDLSPIAGTSVSVDRSMLGQLQNLPGAAVFTFDYHPYSGRWVDDSHLGPAFGQVVDCLYRASGEKVIVVAHSMGGLVARYAATHAGVTSGNRAAEFGTVVTFGTPETGSLLAAIVGGGLDAAALAGLVAGSAGASLGDVVALLRLLLSECGQLATKDIETGTICDRLPAFVRAFDSSAGQALRSGSAQLAALAPWPKGITVDALAGGTTLDIPAGWFSLPWHTKAVPVGDMIVMPDSATGGATLNKTASCAYQLNAVRGATDQVGLWFGLTAQSDAAQFPLGAFSGACFHTSLMRDVELTAEATGAVHDDILARNPVTAAALQRAPVPADCQHGAGTLVNGMLPGIPANHGEMELGWAANPQAMSSLLALGDLNGDGVSDAAAILECDAGGVAWPALLAFYTSGPTLLGYVDLGDIYLRGHQSGENTLVYQIWYDHGTVHARWGTQNDDDPAAIASMDYEATLRWNGSKIVVSGLSAHTEQATADAFITDIHRHDTSAATALSSPQVATDAAILASDYPVTFSTTPACYGVNSPVMPPYVSQADEYAAQRICDLNTGGDGGDLDIVLGLNHEGYDQWHVVFIHAEG